MGLGEFVCLATTESLLSVFLKTKASLLVVMTHIPFIVHFSLTALAT